MSAVLNGPVAYCLANIDAGYFSKASRGQVLRELWSQDGTYRDSYPNWEASKIGDTEDIQIIQEDTGDMIIIHTDGQVEVETGGGYKLLGGKDEGRESQG